MLTVGLANGRFGMFHYIGEGDVVSCISPWEGWNMPLHKGRWLLGFGLDHYSGRVGMCH